MESVAREEAARTLARGVTKVAQTNIADVEVTDLAVNITQDTINYEFTAQNSSDFSDYTATVKVIATSSAGGFAQAVASEEVTFSIGPGGRTRSFSGQLSHDVQPGGEIEVCANVTNLTGGGGGGL